MESTSHLVTASALLHVSFTKMVHFEVPNLCSLVAMQPYVLVSLASL